MLWLPDLTLGLVALIVPAAVCVRGTLAQGLSLSLGRAVPALSSPYAGASAFNSLELCCSVLSWLNPAPLTPHRCYWADSPVSACANLSLFLGNLTYNRWQGISAFFSYKFCFLLFKINVKHHLERQVPKKMGLFWYMTT